VTPEIEAIARHRLLRAVETFKEGECLFNNSSFAGAVNRFYYGAFYAARTLIAFLQMDSAKHSGIISLFQRHFVKTGIINADLARALPRSFEKRQKTDYADFTAITLRDLLDTTGLPYIKKDVLLYSLRDRKAAY